MITSTEPKIYAIRINKDVIEIRKALTLKKKVCRFKKGSKVVMSQTLFEGGKVLGYLKNRDYNRVIYYDYLLQGTAKEITSRAWEKLRRYKI